MISDEFLEGQKHMDTNRKTNRSRIGQFGCVDVLTFFIPYSLSNSLIDLTNVALYFSLSQIFVIYIYLSVAAW